MKILQIISNLGNGGAEKFLVELSNQFSQNNEVIICSFKDIKSDMVFPTLLDPKIRVVTFGKRDGFDPTIYVKLFLLIKKEKANVVHFHLETTFRYLMPIIPLFKGLKFVHTIHSNLNAEKKDRFDKVSKIKYLYKNINFVCISKSIHSDFCSSYKGLRFNLIENGVKQIQKTLSVVKVKEEINRYKTNDETRVFITTGKLDHNKNHQIQVKAFKQVSEDKAILLVIGDDPLENKPTLISLKQAAGKNIFFLGFKPSVCDYLFNSDCFLLSSYEEGLPISILEAYSAGLPVISTPAGGVIDVVEDNVNGFISKDFSDSSFAFQLNRFLCIDKPKINEIKENNIKKFNDRYSIEKCSSAYLKLFN